LPARRAI